MKIERTVPPVGYRLRASDLVRAAYAAVAAPQRETVRAFAAPFAPSDVFALSSGKAALHAILGVLHGLTGRTKVVLPAYTCYSVPSAIVKAGLKPVPVDIAEGSFDYDYDQLASLLDRDRDVLCVLSIHLFGIPANTDAVSSLCKPKGVFVVEDAAQAMGITVNGKRLGTRADVGFFSLGRGKNVTSGSGGLIVTSAPEIAAGLRRIEDALPRPKLVDDLKTLATLCVMSAFMSPSLFWLPAGLPFLKLGETIFHDDFPRQQLSPLQASLLSGWQERVSSLNDARRQAAAHYLDRIAGARDYAKGLPYLRFPLVLTPQSRERLLNAEGGRRLGISEMYPTSVGAIRQLRGRLEVERFERADALAASLVTLPTHPLLTRADRDRICEAVNAAANRDVVSWSPAQPDHARIR